MIQKKFILAAVPLIFGLAGFLQGQELSTEDLSIEPEDLRIEQRVDGGFHLFIRKKPGVDSVLLTESTRDPSLQAANYAYRSPDWNPINGDEIRLLDGKPLPKESGIYSLISSSPQSHPELGQAFHIYIPYILHYGYPYSRHGEVYVVDGTYLNIRSFSLPYGDYQGRFRDNPFVLHVTQRPLEGPPEENYMKSAIDAFSVIAQSGHGDLVYSTGREDLVKKIESILAKERGKALDVVICLDTTDSMRDDIDSVKVMLIPMLRDMIAGFTDFRVGMVLFKDYFAEYLTRVIPFTKDFASLQRSLSVIRAGGGLDIPEAVHEGLYDAATRFTWEAESRLIILIGDAPPHLRPRGKITKSMVDQAVEERNIQVHAILLPQ